MENSEKTKVLIVEDQKMIRDYLEMYLAKDEQFDLVDSTENAAMAEQICEEKEIDLILMDVLTDDGQSGLEATRSIKQRFEDIKIVIVTSLLDERVLQKAKDVGADSLWYKDVSPEELIGILKRTLNGESVFPDSAPEVMIGEASSYEFTSKEKEVLAYMVRGLSYYEIADEMNINIQSVKYHVSNMLQKTGIKNKLQLVLAVQNQKFIVDDV